MLNSVMRHRFFPHSAIFIAATFQCSLLIAQAQSSLVSTDLSEAQELIQHDHPDQAIAILEQLAASQPVPKGVEHELGIAYYRTGKLVEARSAFAKAIEEDESDKESVQMEGLSLYRLGQPEAAIPYLERVRDWMPNANTDAQYVLGLCYLNARRYDDARESFAAQYGEPKDSAGAYLLLATILRRINLPDAAVAQAQKALALSPNLPMAHFMLGQIALHKLDFAEAIRQLEAERAINPGYAPIYDGLGDAYLKQNRMNEAQQALIKAIALDTTLTESFQNMGKLLLQRRDIKTAIMYLKHAERMDPDDSTTHLLLAQAYHRVGQDDDARRESDLAGKIKAEDRLVLDPQK
jgi:tetratricopeptide (TPR) repeat protein